MRKLAEQVFFRLNRRRRFRPNAASAVSAPSLQAAVDLGGTWHSVFPEQTGIKTGGYARLFDDGRATWALERLGGVDGASILELGPLEGGHTYMLDRAGAKSIIAIEGLKSAYLKCLITKEVLGIKSANFLLGNFVAWLENERRRFDVIWASGVLYHMTEPLRLLQLIAEHTDNVFLWTHFYLDDAVPSYARIRHVPFAGKMVAQFERPYLMIGRSRTLCGGVYSGRAWLRRSDLLDALRILDFTHIEIAFEDQTNSQGPSFAIVARKA